MFSPWKRAFLFIFECLPFFLLSLFWPPPFSIPLSLSLSLSLSLYVSLLFFFFIVSFLSFFFVFFLFLVFLFFFPFLSSLLLFHERNNIKTFIAIFSSIFFFFLGGGGVGGFLSCFFFPIPFSYLCFSLSLSYAFVQHQCFWLKNQSWKTPILGQKGGCNKTVFFMNLCFANYEKLSFLGPFLGPILVDVQKHYENRYFSTFSKQPKTKDTILRFYHLGQVGVIICAKLTAT